MTDQKLHTDKKIKLDNNRLPCRGCTINCSNYKHCNGRLWRMTDKAETDKESES